MSVVTATKITLMPLRLVWTPHRFALLRVSRSTTTQAESPLCAREAKNRGISVSALVAEDAEAILEEERHDDRS